MAVAQKIHSLPFLEGVWGGVTMQLMQHLQRLCNISTQVQSSIHTHTHTHT